MRLLAEIKTKPCRSKNRNDVAIGPAPWPKEEPFWKEKQKQKTEKRAGSGKAEQKGTYELWVLWFASDRRRGACLVRRWCSEIIHIYFCRLSTQEERMGRQGQTVG